VAKRVGRFPEFADGSVGGGSRIAGFARMGRSGLGSFRFARLFNKR
jgi:hypothetical protein